jgi:hypothetical protein
MHKNTEMTFRQQDTEIPQQYSQYTQNFQTKKLDTFLTPLQISDKILNTV